MEMLYNAYDNAQNVAGKIHNATGMPVKENVLEDDLSRVMMGLCWNLEIELAPVPALPKLQLCRRSGSDSACCMMCVINFDILE